ncbi:MAG: ATP-dependent helicase [Methanobrevibacter sp.]|nr:ATP-dependent helicase [Methanobrevibacter sp.]
MISYEEFKEIVVKTLKRDISSNQDQNSAISSRANQSLFIVAGPGSGKTTVMVLKILKFIFVDDISPNEILATTFTKKAAKELMSRILSWGNEIKKEVVSTYMEKSFNDEFSEDSPFSDSSYVLKFTKNINNLDLNQIVTGTIDSVAEELLRIHRDAGTNQPVLIEEAAAHTAMINAGLLKEDRFQNEALQEYLAEITGVHSNPGQIPKVSNISRMADILLKIKDVIYYNRVDIDELEREIDKDKNDPLFLGRKKTLNIITEYINALKDRNIYDFTMLENEFFTRLETGKLDVFLKDIKIILIDEYQDTNLLQESIYFEIAKAAISNGGNITVVGDDDQSLYRFRGATVDLFTQFKERAKSEIGIDVEEINLKTNYRSTKSIIELCNEYAEIDDKYQSARVREKPKIVHPENKDEKREKLIADNGIESDKSLEEEKSIPVLGMFRKNQQQLAMDLSRLIQDLVKGKEVKYTVKRIMTRDGIKNLSNPQNMKIIGSKNPQLEKRLKQSKNNSKRIKLKLDEESGSINDIAFLTYSPQEMTGKDHPTFTHLLRKRLEKSKNPQIEVFNPRGQALYTIKPVAILCGLILECIDPQSRVQNLNTKMPKSAAKYLTRWRKTAQAFIKTYPDPVSPINLEEFVSHWQAREPFNRENWPKQASLIELTYKLVTWIEYNKKAGKKNNDDENSESIKFFQDDIEGIVYLETIAQTITQTGFFNKYSANIDFSSEEKEFESISEALWNIFIPIASGNVKLDENLFETFPQNRLNIMSIHQSKGLEFPLTIVDVGSKFSKNSVKEAHLRFPKRVNQFSIVEDKIRNLSPLGKNERDPRDRAFDDLTRLYFVAFSRAQDVLLLVGLIPSLDGYKSKEKHMYIPNIALGWNRDEEFIGFNEIYLI